jgi:hypothetical protein
LHTNSASKKTAKRQQKDSKKTAKRQQKDSKKTTERTHKQGQIYIYRNRAIGKTKKGIKMGLRIRIGD